ncbi:MAG: class II aldolase/adducin family protein [Promethearchaeota archaeon]
MPVRRKFEFDSDDAIRGKIVEVCRYLLERGHNVGTSGNVSHRGVEEGTILLTPSSVPYETMTPDDIVLVSLEDGSVLEGRRNPSSEAKFHARIYAKRKRKVNAVVHAHSVYSTTMAVLHLDLPHVVEEVVPTVGMNGDAAVKCAAYGRAGSEELAANIVEALGRTGNAAFVANHGVVTVGKTLDVALKVLEYVERASRVYLMARATGGEVFNVPPETLSFERDLYRALN